MGIYFVRHSFPRGKNFANPSFTTTSTPLRSRSWIAPPRTSSHHPLHDLPMAIAEVLVAEVRPVGFDNCLERGNEALAHFLVDAFANHRPTEPRMNEARRRTCTTRPDVSSFPGQAHWPDSPGQVAARGLRPRQRPHPTPSSQQPCHGSGAAASPVHLVFYPSLAHRHQKDISTHGVLCHSRWHDGRQLTPFGLWTPLPVLERSPLLSPAACTVVTPLEYQ